MFEMLTALLVIGFVFFLCVMALAIFIALPTLLVVSVTRHARQHAEASQAFAREARTILRALL